MMGLFITISGLVVLINIIYSIVPDEKYGRYCKIFVGTITTLVVINIFSGLPSLDINIDLGNYTHTSEVVKQDVFNDMVKKNISTEIIEYLNKEYNNSINNVIVEYNGRAIVLVTVQISNSNFTEEIKNKVALFCDINSEEVVIEYI
ncbi:MAG: hypothetical protein J6A69_07410 [Clostridia bacterium]|nr:hypothetical protein [Clostridia bacterium]